jgi:hypothetical protein
MKTYGQDILTSQKELKERPFSVPDGYFEAFKAGAISKSSISAAKPLSKLVPYLAVAASIALLLGLGLSFSRKSIDTLSEEDYILFSDNLIRTDFDESDVTEQFAEAELYDEDIIEYLIYIGESPESIELSK